MPVFKVEKTKNYTTMSNFHLKDKTLSLRAKGILSIMLSLPENWDFSQAGLVTLSKDGVDSVRSTLKELEEHGYLVRTRKMNEKGHFKDVEYCVYEHPIKELENPEMKRDKKEKIEEGGFNKSQKGIEISRENPMSGAPTLENIQMENPMSEPLTLGCTNEENPMSEPLTLENIQVENPMSGLPTLDNTLQDNPMSVSPILGRPMQVNPTQLNTKYIKKLNGLNTYPSIPFANTTASAEAKEKKRYSEDPQEQLLLSVYALEDEAMAISITEKKLKERLEYDAMIQDHPEDKQVIDAIISIMVTEVFTTKRQQMRIASGMHQLNIVRKRLLRLNCFHLQKIIENLEKLERDPVNDKQYILACLYNAPNTVPLQNKTEYAEWVNTINERSDAVESCGTDWETHQRSCVQ